LEAIQKSKIVWLFKEGYDIRKTKEEFDILSPNIKEHLSKTANFSPWSELWVYPPTHDHAEFTNHSSTNNLSVVFDPRISREPYFIANRDIKIDEELTNNYHEFDKITQLTKPTWTN
jgi:hypothetical protein